MSKSSSSTRTGLIILVFFCVVAVLAGAYFVISNRDDSEQIQTSEGASQIDVDEPLDTAASNSASEIEKELNELTEDSYSDSDLSDTVLYE